MSIRKHIPNTITCLSLLSGCVASCYGLARKSFICVDLDYYSRGLDFCDGFAARLLKAYSPMGKGIGFLVGYGKFRLRSGHGGLLVVGRGFYGFAFWLFEYVYPLSGVRDPYVFRFAFG